MTNKIDPCIAKYLRDGFKPWGIVIPNPLRAPKGSALYQFRRPQPKRKYDHLDAVIAPDGKLIRHQLTLADGTITQHNF